MNITVITAGSRGDIQPLLAMCIELRRSGHSVMMASHSNFRGFVEKTGTPFMSIMANHQDWLATEAGVKWIETGSSMFGFFKGLKNFFDPVLEDMFRGSIEACRGADLILFSSLAVSAPHVAEKLRIPCIPIQLQPIYPTSEFPSFAAPWKKGGLPILNRFTHWIGEFIMGRLTRKQLNRWRRRELQLSPMPFAGMGPLLRQRQVPHLLCCSQSVLTRPSDWGKHVHQTGYWFLKSTDHDWTPSRELVKFISSGEPPIYLGFGSLPHRNPELITQTLVEGVLASGNRAVLAKGWGNLGASSLPDDILPIDSVPHDWLFPQMKLLVHHGGAGTSSTGFKCGIPSILVPFFADQFFWARRTVELGVGPEFIPAKQLDSAKLESAIQTVEANPQIRRNATALGEKIRAENGCIEAVAVIEEFMKNGPCK